MAFFFLKQSMLWYVLNTPAPSFSLTSNSPPVSLLFQVTHVLFPTLLPPPTPPPPHSLGCFSGLYEKPMYPSMVYLARDQILELTKNFIFLSMFIFSPL